MQELEDEKGETMVPLWQPLADTKAYSKRQVCSGVRAGSWETFALLLQQLRSLKAVSYEPSTFDFPKARSNSL